MQNLEKYPITNQEIIETLDAMVKEGDQEAIPSRRLMVLRKVHEIMVALDKVRLYTEEFAARRDKGKSTWRPSGW